MKKIKIEGTKTNKIKSHVPDIAKGQEIWIKEFYEGIGNAIFLSEQESDTSLRQGYLLLDQSLERFLLNYLKHVKKVDLIATTRNPTKPLKDIPVLFDDILSALNDTLAEDGAKEILYRIDSYTHEIRNELQHRITFTVKIRFDEYLKDIISLCEYMDFDIEHKIMEEKNNITKNILYKKSEEMEEEKDRRLNIIGESLNSYFEIMHGSYEPNIVLIGIEDTCAANTNLVAIILGSFSINTKKSRVLELVVDEDKRLSHTFLISYTDSSVWYCFYKCYWSKQGEEKAITIKNLRNFLEQQKDKIIYEQHYTGNNLFFKSLERYLELTNPDFASYLLNQSSDSKVC